MKKTVAVVDDEPDIVELVSLHLNKSSFNTVEFRDAAGLFEYLKSSLPQLIVLDLMLPDADGFEVCKVLKQDRKYRHIPVIMLTAKGDESDKILGLGLGADDYITKPFSPKELVARVKVVIRRGGLAEEEKNESRRVICHDFFIDLDKYEVTLNGRVIDLTTTEFKILEMLSGNIGNVFPREKMLEILWGNQKVVIDRTIDVHIRHLRKKLGDRGDFIRNIRGIGYKMELPQEETT